MVSPMGAAGGPLIVLVAIVLAFSGCAGAAAKAAPSAAPTTHEKIVSEAGPSSGTVDGAVVDDETKPIAGVQVVLVEIADASVSTDAAGHFTFKQVPTGTYKIVAQRLGYESVAKRITVAVGNATTVTIVLRAIAVSDAYVQVIPYKGFIGFGASVLVVTCRCNVLAAAGPERSFFETNLTKDLKSVVASYVWKSSGPLTADRFNIEVAFDGKDEGGWTGGPSPLIVQRLELSVKEPKKLQQSVWMPYTTDPTKPFFIAYQQSFELYTSLFYHAPGNENYTGLPPG
jgi:hypothetical protein